MCSEMSKKRKITSVDNDIEEIETIKTVFEFTLVISRYCLDYCSPDFVLKGINLHCHIKMKIIDNEIIFSLLFKDDDYKRYCDEKPYFEEILWYNRNQNYNVSIPIKGENPKFTCFNYGTTEVKRNCKVTVTYKMKRFEYVDDSNLTMLSNLQNIYEDKEFTDVIINVAGEEFSAHKVILLGNPVFAAMLTSDMREKNDNTIDIEEMDPAVFKILLRFIYLGNTGKINFRKLGEDFLINLIVATDMYEVKYLNKELIDIAIRYVNSSNVSKLFILADRFKIPVLKEKCMLYIRNHREEVFDSLEFQELIKENPKLTIELLSYVMKNGLP